MINIKNPDPHKIKIDKKSCENVLIYYIRNLRVKDLRYIKFSSLNALCIIINKKMGTPKKSMEINI